MQPQNIFGLSLCIAFLVWIWQQMPSRETVMRLELEALESRQLEIANRLQCCNETAAHEYVTEAVDINRRVEALRAKLKECK